MTASAFWTAFHAVQSELQDPRKDNKVNQGKFSYAYADLHSIMQQVRPVLLKHGLCLTQPMNGDLVTTRLTHTSGEFHEGHTKIAVPDGGTAQQYGSAVSYSRRYGLLSLLALAPAEEDDDGAAASKPPQKAAPARPAAPKVEEPWLVEEAVAAVAKCRSIDDLKRVHIRAMASNFKGEDLRAYTEAKDAKKEALADRGAA